MSRFTTLVPTALCLLACEQAASSDGAQPDASADVAARCDADAASDGAPPAPTPSEPGRLLPRYDDANNLIRPASIEEWVFLGSSVNLNYTGTGAPFPFDVMTNVFMEPGAFRTFRDTGAFPEGTMTALMAYRVGTNAAPAQDGQFPEDLIAFEMSVKDASGPPQETWAYYSFAPAGSDTAPAQDRQNCHD